MDDVRLMKAGLVEVCTEVGEGCEQRIPRDRNAGGWLVFPQWKRSAAGWALQWLESRTRLGRFLDIAQCYTGAVFPWFGTCRCVVLLTHFDAM